jgi:DNA-binding beta-propeller fold protein YncE
MSPLPPIVTGSGTLAVVNLADPKAKRVWAFPPNTDKFTRELLIPGSQYHPNSLAFDRQGHLFAGFNDTSSGGEYHVVEVDLRTGEVVRRILVPQWGSSSVATDDQSNVYVNTKSFVGGIVQIFRANTDTKPYIEIKDHHSPVTMLVTRGSLWIGYEGAFSDALAQYPLRSKDRARFYTIGSNFPLTLAANNDGSLIAAFVRRRDGSGRALNIYDVGSGKLARTILEGKGFVAMTGDASGHLYVSEQGHQGTSSKIHVCTYRGCTGTFETNSARVVALAVSPLDQMLYVSNSGKSSVQAYDPATGKLVTTIALHDFQPDALAIEP